ncbi:hypothetical protein GQ457_09G011670 [Hibiscus cannabinus]
MVVRDAMIRGPASNGRVVETFGMLYKMQLTNLLLQPEHEINVMWDSITLVNVISACGNLALLYEGKSPHGLAIKTFVGSETRVQTTECINHYVWQMQNQCLISVQVATYAFGTA